jgi:hypothetical protein
MQMFGHPAEGVNARAALLDHIGDDVVERLSIYDTAE